MSIDQTFTTNIERFQKSNSESNNEEAVDCLAIEEPLEIRIGGGGLGLDQHRCLSITMRTPGDDAELALGFLWTEGLVKDFDQVEKIYSCGSTGNVIRVQLKAQTIFDWDQLNRNFYMTSSCGVCGKSSIESLQKKSQYETLTPLMVDNQLIYNLPQKVREAQFTFSKTGGLHAATIFSSTGLLLDIKEDVGRHNALDKVIGLALQNSKLPLDQAILVLSGRASFELIQKSFMAGIQFIVAIGAPSSLAVQLAKEMGITLIGFTKSDRYNVYSAKERIGEIL